MKEQCGLRSPPNPLHPFLLLISFFLLFEFKMLSHKCSMKIIKLFFLRLLLLLFLVHSSCACVCCAVIAQQIFYVRFSMWRAWDLILNEYTLVWERGLAWFGCVFVFLFTIPQPAPVCFLPPSTFFFQLNAWKLCVYKINCANIWTISWSSFADWVCARAAIIMEWDLFSLVSHKTSEAATALAVATMHDSNNKRRWIKKRDRNGRRRKSPIAKLFHAKLR